MTTSFTPSAADLVDLERYPLHALDSAAGRRLLRRCQADLAERALCAMDGFIRPEWLARMRDETAALIPRAHYRDEVGSPFDADDADLYPAGHVRHTLVPGRYRQILNHDIANDSLLRKLYHWTPLLAFIRRVYRARTMHRSACPHLALTCKVAWEGDTDGWHYDGNDGVVSLMLQAPDAGGAFEYAPYIRSPGDQRYDAVETLMADPESHAVRPRIEPGTFVLFNGDLSLHRVTPVGATGKPRIIALLSYDREPDQMFGQTFINRLRTFPRDIDAPLAAAR